METSVGWCMFGLDFVSESELTCNFPINKATKIETSYLVQFYESRVHARPQNCLYMDNVKAEINVVNCYPCLICPYEQLQRLYKVAFYMY